MVGEADSTDASRPLLDTRAAIQAVATLPAPAAHPIVQSSSRGAVLAAAERQRQSEEWVRLAFDHGPIGTALIGLDGRYLQVNKAMCDITGYSAEQLLQLAIADITHPDDMPAEVAAACQLLAGDVPDASMDKRFRDPSGHIVWVMKALSLVRHEDGSPLMFIAQIQKATERKKYELALAEERSRLLEAELIGRVGSWDLDADTGEVRWSDALFTLRGLDPDEFDGDWTAASQCVHPDDRERVAAAISECRTTGEPMLVRYRVIRANDGALCWCDARGRAVYDGNRLVRVAGTVVDVTDDVVAAEEAAAAHAFQQAVLKASPDIIFVYDLPAQSVIWTNRSIPEALGTPAGSGSHHELETDMAPVGDVFARFVFPDDQAEFAATLDASRYASGDAVVLLDHRMTHADGSTRWFSRRTTALRRDESGHVTQVVGLLCDQTSRMKIEQERSELQAQLADAKLVQERAELEAQLQQAQRLETVGQLAGGIAHDFNNLLAGITSYASLVSSGLEELRGRERGLHRSTDEAEAGDEAEDGALTVLAQDVEEIIAGARRAAELTRQLLIFSRREVVQPTVLDLNSVVTDLEKLLRRTIGERIELRATVTADGPHILADRGQVEQVVMNLAVNARHAMPDGGQLRIETGQVELTAADVAGRTLTPGEYVHLTVSDTGTGMTPEVADRAFEPFFSTKPKGEGSGLGLATVYGIATQAGGDVVISSRVGFGTTMRVLFPATTDAVTTPAGSQVRSAPTGRGETILLVEDEATVREPARRILTRNGYTVLPAASAHEALDIVSSADSPIDLLLTDVVMPARSGKELADDVTALLPDITVIYMSGHSEDVIAHAGILDNGVTLIQKPCSTDDLLRTVRTTLDARL